MKRLEEIFDTTISEYNKRVSHVYAFKFTDSERKMFLEMIQDYAREVAQASLEKAAENASMKVVTLGIEDCSQMTKSFYHKPSATEISLNKPSITNEQNITLL
ncbi:TPA: hypothetical protein ACG0AV_002057 [Elizabethkingia anophelis]